MDLMKKIVIIEDDMAIAQMYRMKFEGDGFEVFLADNGRTGLELASEVKPDVILLDLLMPEMGGQETLVEIRKSPELGKTPVIILTNTESERAELEARALEVADYIIKANETPSQVVAKTKQILGI